jgi:hypothetical protein
MLPTPLHFHLRQVRFALKLPFTGQRQHTWRYWQSVLNAGYMLDAPHPWMAWDAVAFITAHLPPCPRVFEYGSGASTLYWLSLGARVVSVEHDRAWHAIIRARLPAGAPVDFRQVDADDVPTDATVDAADPAAYRSGQVLHVGMRFERYVRQIDAFPDASFDLVVIDGRARTSCIAHSVAKVKPGGLLVLDDADRVRYTERTAPLLAGFECHVFRGARPSNPAFEQTNVYRKAA